MDCALLPGIRVSFKEYTGDTYLGEVTAVTCDKIFVRWDDGIPGVFPIKYGRFLVPVGSVAA